MSAIIPMNINNVVPSQINTMQYNFPTGSATFKNAKIGIQSVIIPYSFYNITSGYNNQSFQLKFPITDGSATTTISVTIPQGFYTISEINSYIQSVMIQNYLYLIDGSGNNVYYCEFVANTNLNSAQFNSYIVPNSLPASYSQPTGGTWGSSTLPSAGSRVPQLILSSNNFGLLIGFASSTSFPSSMTQSSTYSVVSSFTPQISPTTSIFLGCNLVNGPLTNPSNILGSISITSTFGSQIIYEPSEYLFLPILDGSYPNIRVIFYDQNFNPLGVTDSNIVVNLVIEGYSSNF